MINFYTKPSRSRYLLLRYEKQRTYKRAMVNFVEIVEMDANSPFSTADVMKNKGNVCAVGCVYMPSRGYDFDFLSKRVADLIVEHRHLRKTRGGIQVRFDPNMFQGRTQQCLDLFTHILEVTGDEKK